MLWRPILISGIAVCESESTCVVFKEQFFVEVICTVQAAIHKIFIMFCLPVCMTGYIHMHTCAHKSTKNTPKT